MSVESKSVVVGWSLEERIGTRATGALVDALNDNRAWLLPGDASRFDGLFDDARFRTALQACAGRNNAFGAVMGDQFGDGLTFAEPIAVDAVDDHLARAHTICATNISAFDEELAAATRQMASSLGGLGRIRFNAYRSPEGAHTPMHTDVRASISIQLQGTKRWRYQTKPSRPYPESNAQIDRWGDVVWMKPVAGVKPPAAPVDAQLAEVVLGPGDLLCVPAGAWHEVMTEREGLALNLSVRPTSAIELFPMLVARAFGPREHWRQGVPLTAGAEPGSSVPDEVVRHVRERVAELAEWANGLDAAQLARALWDRR
ncbi:MAG: cupin domain-containing protein [Deltaproteobacteria bacterium]|nr:cupin domain-containing protein [Deltaproteobacteria bacterium]